MIPLILPVISGEEERGVCSSHKKQRKNLQVDQEEEFKQRGDIIGSLQEENKNIPIKIRSPQISACLGNSRQTLQLLVALKCRATISQTRGNYSEIKMTKTRLRAGDRASVRKTELMVGKKSLMG